MNAPKNLWYVMYGYFEDNPDIWRKYKNKKKKNHWVKLSAIEVEISTVKTVLLENIDKRSSATHKYKVTITLK